MVKTVPKFDHKGNQGLINKICESIFIKSSPTDTKKFIEDLIGLHYGYIPYEELTSYVYNHDIKKNKLDIACKQLSDIKDENNKSFIEKSIGYLNEALIQKNYITDNLNNIESKVKKSRSQLKRFNKKQNTLFNDLNTLDKKQNSLDKKQNTLDNNLKRTKHTLRKLNSGIGKMYSDLVTLLGIFTAIAFTIFGGLQLVNALFSKLNFNHPVITMGFVLFIGSVISIIIYGILIILWNGIYKLINYFNGKTILEYPISKSLKKYILWISGIMCVLGIGLIILYYICPFL